MTSRVLGCLLLLAALACGKPPAFTLDTQSEWSISYGGRTYNSKHDSTTFSYVVTVATTQLDGEKGQDLSHWCLGFDQCSSDALVSAPGSDMAINLDPTTNFEGLKWDGGLAVGKSYTYTVTLKGNLQAKAAGQAVFKGAQRYSLLDIEVPSCTEEKIPTCDGVTAAALDDVQCNDGQVTVWLSSYEIAAEYKWGSDFGVISDFNKAISSLVLHPDQCAFSVTITLEMTTELGSKVECSLHRDFDFTTDLSFVSVPTDDEAEAGDLPQAKTPVLTDESTCFPVTLSYDQVEENSKVIRTWGATDKCSSVTASQTIVVSDTMSPEITGIQPDETRDCDDVPPPCEPVAWDSFDGEVVISYSEWRDDGSCPMAYKLIRTWKTIDSSGNTADGSQTISVTDTESPKLVGVPADATVECSALPPAQVVTAEDNCDPAVDIDFSEQRPGNGKVIRTWTATDSCGNSDTGSQTILVIDSHKPELHGVQGDTSVHCDAVPAPCEVSARDVCDGYVAVTFSHQQISGTCNSSFTIINKWVATDTAGNSATDTQTIVVTDDVPPVLYNVPQNNVVTKCHQVIPNTVVAEDDCSGIVDVNTVEQKMHNISENEYQLIRTYTATDACGNTATDFATIIVKDTVAPVLIGLPAPSARVQCDNIPDFAPVEASDNCQCNGTDILVVETDERTISGTCDHEFTLIRTWTAVDCADNKAEADQTIHVVDHESPTLSQKPAHKTVDCNEDVPVETVEASDNCDMDVVPVYSTTDNKDESECGSFIEWRQWVATDDCGNSDEYVQTIEYVDRTSPHWDPKPESFVESNCTAEDVTAEATDDCSAYTVNPEQTSKAGTCDYEYHIFRKWTAVDACGNENTTKQTVTVMDREAPVLECQNYVVTVEQGSPHPDPPEYTASDNCEPVTPTYTTSSVPLGCSDYEVTRKWDAADSCGNAAPGCTWVITVKDTTPPIWKFFPDDSTAECHDDDFEIPVPTIVEEEHEDLTPVPSKNCQTVNTTCLNKYVMVCTWTAADKCGNVVTRKWTHTVDDNKDPTLDPVQDSEEECGDLDEVPTPGASDNCDENPHVAKVDPDGSATDGDVDYIFRKWTATDVCGNIGEEFQTVTIKDTRDPKITCPSDPTPDDCENVDWVDPEYSDLCGAASLTYSDDQDGDLCTGLTVTRTWTVTDEVGRTAECDVSYDVHDETAPTCPNRDDKKIECTDTMPVMLPIVCTESCATDVITYTNSSHPVQFEPVVGSKLMSAEYRKWVARDECANEEVVVQTIFVEDTTPPTMDKPAGYSITCEHLEAPTVYASDNCSQVSVELNETTVAGTCDDYKVHRTWVASDTYGNTDQHSHTVTVTGGKSLSWNENVSAVWTTRTVEYASDLDFGHSYDWDTLTAEALCRSAVVTCTPVKTNGTCPNEYTIIRTCVASDPEAPVDCVADLSYAQTVTVEDTTPPEPPVVQPDDWDCADPVPDPIDTCSYSEPVSGSRSNGCYKILLTCSATDECGLYANAHNTITVTDSSPPSLTPPAHATVECDEIPDRGNATASDDCSPSVSISNLADEEEDNLLIRGWKATDNCGNTNEAYQTITIVDTTPPEPCQPTVVVVDCEKGDCYGKYPEEFNCECLADIKPSDNCGTPTTSCEIETESGTCLDEFSRIVTWTTVDAYGNKGIGSYTVMVEDTTPPVWTDGSDQQTLPSPRTVAGADIPQAPELEASDSDGTDLDVTYSTYTIPADIDELLNYTIVRNWSAQDACGNVIHASQIIVVEDYEPPVVGVPANVTYTCSNPDVYTDDDVDVELARWYNASYTVTKVGPTRENGTCAANFNITTVYSVNNSEYVNSATWMQHIVDLSPPVWDVPLTDLPASGVWEGCNDPPAVDITASDDCVEQDEGQNEHGGAYFQAGPVDVQYSQETVASGIGGDYDIHRLWTAEDDCGQSISHPQTILVRDTTPPEWSELEGIPDDETVDGCEVPEAPTVTATDPCSDVTVVMVEKNGTLRCAGKNLIRTWTATDARGNKIEGSQTIFFTDDDKPTFLTPYPEDRDDDLCDSGFPEEPNVEAEDACGDVTVTGPVLTTLTDPYSSLPVCGKLIIRTWTATDTCGNNDTISQTITSSDSEAPVVTPPADETVTCADLPSKVVPANVTDDCHATLEPVDQTSQAGSCDGNYFIIRTWTGNDACRSDTESQTITVVDTTPPELHDVPMDRNIECGETYTPTPPTATDCGTAVTVQASDPVELYRKIIYEWTAMDSCGNTVTDSQTVSLIDTTPPTLTCDNCDDHSVEACEGEPVAPTPNMTDCSEVTLEFGEISEEGSCDNSYTILRKWVATDAYGNTKKIEQVIVFHDTTSPKFTPATLESPRTCECDQECDPPVVNATDCGEDMEVAYTRQAIVDSDGDAYDDQVHTWDVVDACGNSDTLTQTVTYVNNYDPELPDVHDKELDCSEAYTPPTVDATHPCEDVTPVLTNKTLPGDCDGEKIMVFEWKVTDSSGHTDVETATVTWSDSTPPVLEFQPTIVEIPDPMECEESPKSNHTVTDDCDAMPVTRYYEESLDATDNCQTRKIRIWEAEDDCGNQDEGRQTICVRDTIPPNITCDVCGEVTINKTCGDTPHRVPVVTAFDICQGYLDVNETNTTTGDECHQTIVYNYQATDGVHTVYASHTVHIVDNTGPTILNPPANVQKSCEQEHDFPNLTATECDVTMPITPEVTRIDDVTVNDYKLVATWTISDDCSNGDTHTQTVTFSDEEPPVIRTSEPPLVQVSCKHVPEAQNVSVDDNCDENVTATFNERSEAGSCEHAYIVIRTWDSTDVSGNEATQAVQTIVVSDTEAPHIEVSGQCTNRHIECDEPPPECEVSAVDDCDENPDMTNHTVSIAGDSVNDYFLNTTWTFCDDCGNCASRSQFVTVNDTTPPVVDGPGDESVEYPAVPALNQGDASATDNCAPVTPNCTEEKKERECLYSFLLIRTCSATDDSDNTGWHVHTIHVVDSTPPTIIGVPDDSTVEYGQVPPLNHALDHVVAVDNSGGHVPVTVTESRIDGVDEKCQQTYTLIRKYTAIDNCTNIAVEFQTIAVEDTTPPTFCESPRNETVQCDAIPEPCEMHSCGEVLDVDCTTTRLDNLIIHTCSVEDNCGNDAVHVQSIVIEDTVPPVLSRLPEDETVNCNCETFPPPPNIVALDNCDEEIEIDFTGTRVDTDSEDEYTIVRVWTATDEAGNRVSHTQSIVVVDEEGPALYPLFEDVDAKCNTVPDAVNVHALDNCDPDAEVTKGETELSRKCAHTYTFMRTWNTQDRTGNPNSHTQTVAVTDDLAPEINQGGVSCLWPADSNMHVFTFDQIFSTRDNCAPSVSISFISCNSTVSDQVGDCAPSGTTGITIRATPGVSYNIFVSATDECDNSVDSKAIIWIPATVEDYAASDERCVRHDL